MFFLRFVGVFKILHNEPPVAYLGTYPFSCLRLADPLLSAAEAPSIPQSREESAPESNRRQREEVLTHRRSSCGGPHSAFWRGPRGVPYHAEPTLSSAQVLKVLRSFSKTTFSIFHTLRECSPTREPNLDCARVRARACMGRRGSLWKLTRFD